MHDGCQTARPVSVPAVVYPSDFLLGGAACTIFVVGYSFHSVGITVDPAATFSAMTAQVCALVRWENIADVCAS